MSAGGSPIIVPGRVNVMGQLIEVVADVDPEKFPDGMMVLLFDPKNQLVPIGGGTVNKRCMLGIVPPEMANQLREAMHRQAQPQPGAGQIHAPGLG